MKEYDVVEVIVEKEKYAKEGVHKWMQGTILDPRNIDGQWLVYFADETGADTIGIAIKEVDLKLIREDDYKTEVHVEVIADKEQYARMGVRAGMRGVIRDLARNDGYWLVHFVDPSSNKENDGVLIKREDFKLLD